MKFLVQEGLSFTLWANVSAAHNKGQEHNPIVKNLDEKTAMGLYERGYVDFVVQRGKVLSREHLKVTLEPRKENRTMIYVVEKGIPIPDSRFGRDRKGKSKYPFARMKVGDSFFSKHNIQSIARAYGKRSGMVFSTRKVEGGWRAWRKA